MEAVEDRGEEDVWALLDAVAEGRSAEAVKRLSRHLAGAEDQVAARLSFFALLAGFCRQLVAVKGAVMVSNLPSGERSYHRFKERLAPRLTASLPGMRPNPLGTVHPFRLHRAYLAASRLRLPDLNRLPCQVLETELALKGGNDNPEAVLFSFVTGLASLFQRPR
jgi:hypothetical protein